MSVEILIVAGVYAASGLWLLWAMRDLFEIIPDMFSGLFDENSFVFAISWLVLLIVSILLYLVVALLGVGVPVVQGRPARSGAHRGHRRQPAGDAGHQLRWCAR